MEFSERIFAHKPVLSVSADPKGINHKVQGDPVAIALMLGLAMKRNPQLKSIIEIALNSINAPEIKQAYDDVARAMITIDQSPN